MKSRFILPSPRLLPSVAVKNLASSHPVVDRWWFVTQKLNFTQNLRVLTYCKEIFESKSLQPLDTGDHRPVMWGPKGLCQPHRLLLAEGPVIESDI